MTATLERPADAGPDADSESAADAVRGTPTSREPSPADDDGVPVGPLAAPPTATRQPTRSVSITRAIALSVVLLGALALGLAAYLAVLAPVQQARAQQLLHDTLAEQFGLATAPVSGVIPVGAPVALIEVPRLGLAQVVVEGTASGVLASGPGHRRDTPLPGQAGLSVIMGRSGLFGAPFAGLGELRRGDEIIVTTGQGEVVFEVAGRRDSTQAIPPPSGAPATLVLSTAWPPLAPDRSLIVTAELTAEPFPGRVDRTAVTDAEKSLQGDPGAALAIMLWSQALLLVVAATTWAYLRRDGWVAYLISTPILLAVLWNLYENLAQLLPNTM